MKKNAIILIAVFAMVLISGNVSSKLSTLQEKYTIFDYIMIYKPFAIMEMKRSGIPASITMAQAILESGFGNSELAINANNHFGIKNKPEWKGQIYYKDNCCYKKYNSVLESYEDHSNHLKSRKWYEDLFKLKVTDYKGWAYGLKKAGYAEDPTYAYKLIRIIETYDFLAMDRLYTPFDSTFAEQQNKKDKSLDL
jgi:flagellum-specific peptidoglycan hydrolase FlgJ